MRVGGEFLRGQRKPVGHVPLRRPCDEKALAGISCHWLSGAASRLHATHYGRAILMPQEQSDDATIPDAPRADRRHAGLRRPGARPDARQGLVRHQLGRRGRAWRLLSGGRGRHLQEIRPRRDHRAGRPAGEQPLLLLVGQDRFLHERATRCRASTRWRENIPTVVVAAAFQKEPQVLLAHPGQGFDKFEDLKKATLFISSEGLQTYLQMDAGRVRLRAREGEALHLQSRAVPGRQEERDAGLCDVRAVRGREEPASSSRKSSCSPITASTPTRR